MGSQTLLLRTKNNIVLKLYLILQIKKHRTCGICKERTSLHNRICNGQSIDWILLFSELKKNLDTKDKISRAMKWEIDQLRYSIQSKAGI